MIIKGDTLKKGEKLSKGEFLSSENGRFTFEMQRDGNLVLYHRSMPLWMSNTQGSGEYTNLTADGNLVVVGKDNAVLWESKTKGRGEYLVLQDDAYLVLNDSNGMKIWSTETLLSKGF